jgi:hypothetical protein
MQKFDITMHERLLEEIYRISNNDLELSRKLGSTSNVVGNWVHKWGMPNAYYLGALYKQGADVLYILTGERLRNDQTGSKNYR